jgi:hypothetical protein
LFLKSNEFRSGFRAWKCCALNSDSTPNPLVRDALRFQFTTFPDNAPTISTPARSPSNASPAHILCIAHHKPCLNQSPNFAFPNCARLFIPCSLKSMPFNCVTSCVGALLTRCTIIVGSVSRIIPSSIISSIAKETRS